MKKPDCLKSKEKLPKRNKGINQNFEKRKADYNKLKELRQKLKEKKQERIQSVYILNKKYFLIKFFFTIYQLKRERKRLEDKKKRKEMNDLKSGKYDIVMINFSSSLLISQFFNFFQIKNPNKIKKWTKKARQTLTKMPADLFYEKYGGK